MIEEVSNIPYRKHVLDIGVIGIFLLLKGTGLDICGFV